MAVTEEEIIKVARRSRRAAIEFVIHCFVGACCFLAVASTSCGIHWVVEWLHRKEMSSFVILGLTMAEYALFAADICVFLVFIFLSAIRAIKCL